MTDTEEARAEIKRTMTTSKENNRLLWWIMGIVAAVLVSLGGFWANAMYSSVEGLREGQNRASDSFAKALAEVAAELRVSQIQHLERIVKLEAYSQAQRDEINGMRNQTNERLIRIETKIDELRK